MSSINNITKMYQQIYSQNATQTQGVQRHHHQSGQSQGQGLAVSDQIQISSDGTQALQQDRMRNHHVNPLDELVKNGTLTQDQKTAIEDAFKAARNEQESSEAGTDIEVAEASSSQNAVAKLDPLGDLVTNGTITDDQKNAIKTALDAARPHHGGKRPDGPPPGGMPPGFGKEMDGALNSLVDNGTLTKDQKTAVQKTLLAMIDAIQNSDGTDSTSSSSSSSSSSLADYLSNSDSSSSNSSNFMEDILNKLVEQGTLTDQQKNAVTQSIQNANTFGVHK